MSLQTTNKLLSRCNIYSNFNFTNNEIIELLKFVEENKNKIFYLWSNVEGYNNNINNTCDELLKKVLNHKRIKIGFTVNPKLKEFIKPKLLPKYFDNIIIKYCYTNNEEINKATWNSFEYGMNNNLNIMIIPMRIQKNEIFYDLITKDCRQYYEMKKNEHKSSYKRLKKETLINQLIIFKSFYSKIYPCDLLDNGCLNCLNCYRINNLKPNLYIDGINLESSGKCNLNCPDCYANNNMRRTKNKISYNKFTVNEKMKVKEDKLLIPESIKICINN